MEKFDNKNQNMVADEELDQITGGRKLFDLFTTEFRGKAKKPTTLEMFRDAEDDGNDFTVSTLEMRENPISKEAETGKIIKL